MSSLPARGRCTTGSKPCGGFAGEATALESKCGYCGAEYGAHDVNLPGKMSTPESADVFTPILVLAQQSCSDLTEDSLRRLVAYCAHRYRGQLLGILAAPPADQLFLVGELLATVQLLPGTKTGTYVERQANLKLNGPVNDDFPNIIKGYDNERRIPVVVKLPNQIAGTGHVPYEVSVVERLALQAQQEHFLVPISPVVVALDESAARYGITRGTGNFTGLKMPQYVRTLSEHPIPPASDLLAALRNVRCALAYLHSKGWAHNDVKPANIFMDANGVCFLGDYDACCEIGQPVQRGSTNLYHRPFLREPASPAVDYYMLASTLAILWDGGHFSIDYRVESAGDANAGGLMSHPALVGLVGRMRASPSQADRDLGTAIQELIDESLLLRGLDVTQSLPPGVTAAAAGPPAGSPRAATGSTKRQARPPSRRPRLENKSPSSASLSVSTMRTVLARQREEIEQQGREIEQQRQEIEQQRREIEALRAQVSGQRGPSSSPETGPATPQFDPS